MSDSEYVLVLRTCDQDHRSYGGFQWPELGPVECPDWNPSPVCGGGLHGLLWGAGDWTLVDISPDAVWKVVRVLESEIVDLGGKVKFPRGEVVYSGTRDGATGYIVANGGTAYPPRRTTRGRNPVHPVAHGQAWHSRHR